MTGSQVKTRTDEELLAEIAVILGFSVEALRSKSRQRPLVTARQTAMYVFRELTDLSYPSIARLFGGRDHHRHPRRREDPAADEGAQAGVRPGHRRHPAAEDQLSGPTPFDLPAPHAASPGDVLGIA
ncbi:MAG: helix-turn-helix domain-containing protein [Ilumatobacteraceae bacterium]